MTLNETADRLRRIADELREIADELAAGEIDVPIYDQEEIHHGCTVQVLRNSVTGAVSIGWWTENEDENDL